MEYSIKITGQGTREEITRALQLILNAVNPDTAKIGTSGKLTDIDGAEWEDCTLMAEISAIAQPRVLHPKFVEYIAEIVGRKQNGIDCAEEESGIIKHFIVENSENILTDQVAKDNDDYIASLFPCEYSEAWEMIEEK